ncbi:Ras like protein family, member T1 [Trypanosoma grayi]|uniref:Ras like protein family, member T1 n=1 Tax=Trypanosoma grayi TaxID=71804 RepID=UPI0004F41D0A|nr:Ras like protein family, member T1 [Trypanosoma grayi]KEG09666.1 Ras like protein family, member T1 [Trypanosoma grayi]
MVLASLRVLVCGTDVQLVENAFGTSVENANHAWNRRYSISCTSASGVDHVDTRLLSMCHLVVLTRGATSPPTALSYSSKPTVSLDGAPEAALRIVKDCDFYYGMYSTSDLRSVIVNIGLAPPHVIWDTTFHSLTHTGLLALRRAFWLLDKDGDGVLNEEELLTWQRSVTSASFSTADLSEMLASESLEAAPMRVDCERFMIIQEEHLRKGDAVRVWATLFITGLHPDGLPYSWQDLHAIRVSKVRNTYLSHTAIQFFRNLYRLHRFQDLDDMWDVTPGCPWKHINGFLVARIPLDKFIEYWKYMALVKRDIVVQYARYWGYKGDTSLLFMLRNARPYREVGETVPNTIQVLVLGAPGCGRRSLMFTLTAGDEEFREEGRASHETYVRTTTFFVRNGEEEVPQTVVYATVPIESVAEVLGNEALEKQVDVVLLCYDGTRVAETTPPIMHAYRESTSSPLRCRKLPFIVVMTKAESPATTDTSAEASRLMEQFCRQHQLLWPPVVTSVENPEDSEVVTLNEYMHAVAKEPDIAVGNPPVTTVRMIRRAAIVAMVGIVVGGVVRFVVRRARRTAR